MDIIFDLDGTLWDSSHTILKAWKGIFHKYSIEITLNDITGYTVYAPEGRFKASFFTFNSILPTTHVFTYLFFLKQC